MTPAVISPAQTRVFLALKRVHRRDGRAVVRTVAAEAGLWSLGEANRIITELWRVGLVADDAGVLRPLDDGAWTLVTTGADQ